MSNRAIICTTDGPDKGCTSWDHDQHVDARHALEQDPNGWGSEYGAAAMDEIERLRAEVERLAPFEAHVSWLWGDTEPGKTPGDMVDRARKRLLMYLVAVHRMSPGGAVEMADAMASDVLEAALRPTARDKTGEDALTIATALEAALNPKEEA